MVMSTLHLDLHDKARVVDFIAEYSDYSSSEERRVAQELAKTYADGQKVATDALAQAARKLAIAVWPARYAVEMYFAEKGAEEEWNRVLSAIRPSTAHLLKRFRQGTDASSLDEVLNHEDAHLAIKEEESLEIAEIRRHVRMQFWLQEQKKIESFVKEGKKLMDAYAERLGRLRELAIELPSSLQNDVFAKLMHYEDKILYAGEVVPLEILDQEVQYYNEQKEISPMEE